MIPDMSFLHVAHVTQDSDAGLQYVQSQLSRTLGKSLDNDQLLALVEAGEEPIVDVLLYMIPPTGL